MAWFFFTIISPVLNGLVNYIDKYLIDRVTKGKGIGSLIIFSALMGLPIACIILIFTPNVFEIQLKYGLLIILSGALYVAWVLPYLYALRIESASTVMPLFQLSSVLALILGYFILGESLTYTQLLGCFFILTGALGISIEQELEATKTKRVKLKLPVLGLVSLSCLFIAVSGVIFKFVALEETFWVTSFWENIGIFATSLILFCVSSYRREFTILIKKNGLKILSLNFANEVLITIARISLNYATLLAPLSFVYFVDSGFQPFFVLAYGLIFSTFFPKFSNEKFNKKLLLQKMSAICVMFGGTYLLSF